MDQPFQTLLGRPEEEVRREPVQEVPDLPVEPGVHLRRLDRALQGLGSLIKQGALKLLERRIDELQLLQAVHP